MPVSSLLYLFYSLVILIVILITLLIGFVKGWNKVSKPLAFIIPLSILMLIYFWSQNTNNLVNSFISSEKNYECTSLGETKEIPLPQRTVLIGKSEVCDYSYRTYIKEESFVEFYKNELNRLKQSQLIKDYSYEQSQFIVQTLDFNVAISFSTLDNDYKMIYFQVQE